MSQVPELVLLENGYADISGLSKDIKDAYVSYLEVAYDPWTTFPTRGHKCKETRRWKKLISVVRDQFSEYRKTSEVMMLLAQSELVPLSYKKSRNIE